MAVIEEYGGDILASEGMQAEKGFMQHGTTSTYEHSLSVTVMCLRIAAALHIKTHKRELVRGALLHDYCLYDWHEPHEGLHAFTHPKIAGENAQRDFAVGEIEKNMILSHMFPLGRIPRYRESAILCLADKLCALRETFHRKKGKKEKKRNREEVECNPGEPEQEHPARGKCTPERTKTESET